MKHRKFTTEEREELLKNPNISKVLNSNVEYNEEFKQKALYEHKELGKTANQIFKEAGIPDWLNIAGGTRLSASLSSSMKDEKHYWYMASFEYESLIEETNYIFTDDGRVIPGPGFATGTCYSSHYARPVLEF